MEGGDEEVLPPIGLYMAEWFFAAFLVDLRSIWLTEMERDQYYDSGNVPTITTTTDVGLIHLYYVSVLLIR